MENPAVTRFREFIRIETVQPTPDYPRCMDFLSAQAKEIGLPFEIVECAPGKPAIIMTWQGSSVDPSLSSIMLNCHSDVVPVFEDSWTHPPFAAYKAPNGDIFGRGTQDMKCVGMSYLEAIRSLKARNWIPFRTFHVIFVPDEEVGGVEGMMKLTHSPVFQKLNIGFAMDEGLANPGDSFKVYYGERAPFWIKVIAKGNVGHGSQFIENTAAEKLHKIINKILAFRESEKFRLETMINYQTGKALTLGDVTTVNWTMAGGGVQLNVVPEELTAGFDIRVSPSTNLTKFRHALVTWCEQAGCSVEFLQDTPSNPVTPVDSDNPWLKAIQKASGEFGVQLDLEVFPAATDSRFLRLIGIPALGVSPIRHTKILLHDHDEYLNENVYLDGIKWYELALVELGSVTKADEAAMTKMNVSG